MFGLFPALGYRATKVRGEAFCSGTRRICQVITVANILPLCKYSDLSPQDIPLKFSDLVAYLSSYFALFKPLLTLRLISL